MKVVILSTFSKSGGAAIAANRLMNALNKNGVKASMLCRKNITWGPKALRKQSWTSIWERFVVWILHCRLSMKGLWSVDIANCGQDITAAKEFREADVIHLHWVNQGFLSLDTIEEIVGSGKRIVWTMHDEWPLDSIWHYTDEATPVTCLSRKVAERKRQIYGEGNITFVACSEWLAGIARRKPLGKGQEVVSIPNPIDTKVFHPMDKAAVRDALSLPKGKKLILFTCQKVTDERKGFTYLVEALRSYDRVGVVLVGGNTQEVASLLPGGIETFPLGMIRDPHRMAQVYAAVDAFVTPSLFDNLPNTIMESMACGTPCVGFNVGGIPEMIDHKVNGYIAEYKDSRDLSAGIEHVLTSVEAEKYGTECVIKVEKNYSEAAVAARYAEVYGRKCQGGHTEC